MFRVVKRYSLYGYSYVELPAEGTQERMLMELMDSKGVDLQKLDLDGRDGGKFRLYSLNGTYGEDASGRVKGVQIGEVTNNHATNMEMSISHVDRPCIPYIIGGFYDPYDRAKSLSDLRHFSNRLSGHFACVLYTELGEVIIWPSDEYYTYLSDDNKFAAWGYYDTLGMMTQSIVRRSPVIFTKTRRNEYHTRLVNGNRDRALKNNYLVLAGAPADLGLARHAVVDAVEAPTILTINLGEEPVSTIRAQTRSLGLPHKVIASPIYKTWLVNARNQMNRMMFIVALATDYAMIHGHSVILMGCRLDNYPVAFTNLLAGLVTTTSNGLVRLELPDYGV